MAKTLTTEQFIAKARKIHGDKYDYSQSVYSSGHLPITILCPKHGYFTQMGYSHLAGHGCPTCANETKKSHLIYGVATNNLFNMKGTSLYLEWRNMLQRCYSESWKKKHPCYVGCSVCNEWLSLGNFKEWFDTNYISGYQLDKDILVKGNKVYSPETCCFVPQEINKLTTNMKSRRGKYPQGVSYQSKGNWARYYANISINSKWLNLGCYTTPEEAFQAYKSAKEQYVKEIATKYFQEGKITHRVYQALMEYQVEITD